MSGFNGNIEAGALHPSDVVNNLTSTLTTAPLSANMGKALNEAIAQSAVGGAGFLKTQDGTLLQWGIVDSSGSSGMTVNFAVPFVGATPNVFITPFYNSLASIRCIYSTGGNASTQVTVYAYDVTTNAMSTATNLNFRWLAIGKWK